MFGLQPGPGALNGRFSTTGANLGAPWTGDTGEGASRSAFPVASPATCYPRSGRLALVVPYAGMVVVDRAKTDDTTGAALALGNCRRRVRRAADAASRGVDAGGALVAAGVVERPLQ